MGDEDTGYGCEGFLKDPAARRQTVRILRKDGPWDGRTDSVDSIEIGWNPALAGVILRLEQRVRDHSADTEVEVF